VPYLLPSGSSILFLCSFGTACITRKAHARDRLFLSNHGVAAGQILVKFGVRHHVEAAFLKGISHVVTSTKNDCQYGGVPGLILLKLRIGLAFVKSEVILGTVRLYVFCAVSEDSGLLTCDALLLNEWLQTFRRTVSHSSSRGKKLQKKR
jgi:hypothetical protein